MLLWWLAVETKDIMANVTRNMSLEKKQLRLFEIQLIMKKNACMSKKKKKTSNIIGTMRL